MSRRYENKEREIVTRRECVGIRCDVCDKAADYPLDDDDMGFRWGGVGTSGGSLVCAFAIDGDYDINKLDLCYECADALVSLIQTGRLTEIIGKEVNKR